MPRRFPFRLLAASPTGDHVPDTDLLGRFVRDRDPAAFELLVRRHAAAVWIACRQVCRSEPDAEDAFQAAFLVLSRKAGSVRGPCVGGWLHRVAVNAALKLRARTRRQPALADALPEPATEPRPGLEEAEVAGLVQEEVSRLPERYRLPVVLCDLEGHTHAEAAAVLSWPVGSVSGRLSRARALLRDRLTQRGLAPAVGAALVVPAAGVPAGAVRAAVAAVSGTATIPVSVSILTEGVLSAMRIAKLKLAAVVVVSTGLLVLGGGTLVGVAQMPAQEPKGEPPAKVEAPPAAAQPDPPRINDHLPPMRSSGAWGAIIEKGAFPEIQPPTPKVAGESPEALAKEYPHIFGPKGIPDEPNDDTYRRLVKASLHQKTKYLLRIKTRINIGQLIPSDFPSILRTFDEMRDQVLDLWATNPKLLVPWLEELLKQAKEQERFTLARVQIGQDPVQWLDLAISHRLKAEAALWKAKNPKPPGR